MMLRLGFIILCLLANAPLQAGPPEGYPFHAYDKAVHQAQTENKPLFVYFGRYGCGYCEKTNKEAFSDKRIHEKYTENYILAYVDAESGKRLRLPSGERITERELGTRYDAFVTPVFSFLTPQGDSLLKLIGVQRIEDLLEADAVVQKKIGQVKSH